MEIRRVAGGEAERARGVAIVIDVSRAFTVAAYALAGGARGLWLVRTVEEARALRAREPEALLIGEIKGRLIPGFDHNNSPSRMAAAEVRERLLIQRTGAGTQGAVGAINATHILIAALVNARATVRVAAHLARASDGVITLVPTATWPGEAEGVPNEDDVCADYIEAGLRGAPDAAGALARALDRLRVASCFAGFTLGDPDEPLEDVPAMLATDRFAFAMRGTRQRWRDISYIEVRRGDEMEDALVGDEALPH